MSNPDITNLGPRFVPQNKTAAELLSTHTVGIVAVPDSRKRRAEGIEQQERGAQDSGRRGCVTPVMIDGGASTPKESMVKKKKRKVGTPKLSFGVDGEGEAGDSGIAKIKSSSASTKSGADPDGTSRKKKMTANTSIGVTPKALTKAALLREAQTRETLRKEFLIIQESVKNAEIAVPFVFYDGTNIPGGMCRVKKGDFIWVFLDKSRKVGAEGGVGGGNSNRAWAKIGVDDLMLVRGGLIIPHHYDFYYFIINHTLGPNNRLLFDYSTEPPPFSESSTPEPSTLDTYNAPFRPSDRAKTTKEPINATELEGANDDPAFTKVVDRRWYERNKHIFPASVWQEFDPEKDYQKEVKRDLGGNAFFFS